MTRVKNRVHALLEKYELTGFNGTDIFGGAGMEWLREIRVELSGVDQMILDACIRDVEVLNQLIDEAEPRIAGESVESEEVKLLMTIPGVDFCTALLFVGEIGDIGRFSSSGKLVSWLGLAPRVHQSGNMAYHGRITHGGLLRG